MAITMEELKRKAKAYDVALERAKEIVNNQNASSVWKDWLRSTFPELKESKGEEIRKELMDFVVDNTICKDGRRERWITWLEKQVPIDEDKIVKGIKRGVAISLMNHIDANSKGMCLSNMECEDIENAIINEDWDKVYGYMKKKLSQQEVTKKSDQEEGFIEIPFGAYDSEFIEDTYFIPEGCYAVIVDDMVVIKKGERKPAWTEEDECYMSECIGAIATKDGWSFEEKRKTKLWLFSLKQRIRG